MLPRLPLLDLQWVVVNGPITPPARPVQPVATARHAPLSSPLFRCCDFELNILHITIPTGGREVGSKGGLCCQLSDRHEQCLCLRVRLPGPWTHHGWQGVSDQRKVSEEASIRLTNIAICTIYLLPHLIADSSATEHIPLPIFRPVFCFLQQLAHTLWCPCWGTPWGESVRAGDSAAGRSTGDCRSGAAYRASGTTNSSQVRLNTTNTTRNQHRKRKRKDDDENEPPDRIQKPNPSQIPCPFACPFYLHDRHEWCNCLRNYTLNRIVDVRLHLLRVHLLAPQCPLCGEEFEDDAAQSDSAEDRCNAHIELQICQPLPSPPPARHGLTRDQFEAVRLIAGRRNGRRVADPHAEKWFEMWDIIFPNSPRPISPYINDHPDVQRIMDMNHNILAGEQWRGLTLPTRGSSPSLQNASRSTIMTITERLTALYRGMYREPNGQAPAAVASTVAETPVTSSMGDSLQQRHSWELMSAPGLPAQATEDPLPPVHPATANTGHDQWTLPQTHEYLSSDARSHNNNILAQSLSPFESDPGFSMDTHIADSIFSFQDVADLPDPPARPGSPSQFFNNDYGSSTSEFWGHPGDTADEA